MRWLVGIVALAALSGCRSGPKPALGPGAAAPAFSLPGVDGRTHTLADYAESPVLAVVFTCNHCPAAQLYERRIQALSDAYRDKHVAIVAINPNSPAAMRAEDLAYSDAGDSLADMKKRAAFRHLDYPYLYDGDAQTTSRAFGVTATPQIFVFDRERKLRYEGRLDDNVRESLVTTHDARDAIDALLAGQPVRVAATPAAGCPPVWAPASPPAAAAEAPVSVELASKDTLQKVRANGTGNLTLVNFWATWCGPCAVEFPDLVETSRMYRARHVELVSISENQPEEKDLVLAFLRKHSASNRNLLFSMPQTYDMQAAFDPLMPSAVPFTMVIASNGDVLYQELGSLDILKMRRAILSNLPDDRDSPGAQAYWSN